MQLLKTVFFVLVAILWAAVTSHCQLEVLPAFDFIACEEAAAQGAAKEEDCCNDEVCTTVEEGLFFQHQPQPTAFKVVSVLPFDLFAALLRNVESEFHVSRTIIDTSPQLPPSWQFVYRTALPPRAPSLVS